MYKFSIGQICIVRSDLGFIRSDLLKHHISIGEEVTISKPTRMLGMPAYYVNGLRAILLEDELRPKTTNHE